MNDFQSQRFNYSQASQIQTLNAAQKIDNNINKDSKDAIDFNIAMTVDSIKSDEILRMLTQGMKAGSSMNV